MAKTMATGVEPFDRLEEKIKLLVSTIGRLKGEQSRLAEDNSRLQRDVESLQARVSRAEDAGSEVAALKQERDLVRARVGEILAELDTLKL
jgi:FtsZ-binding cell division protein ZapB